MVTEAVNSIWVVIIIVVVSASLVGSVGDVWQVWDVRDVVVWWTIGRWLKVSFGGHERRGFVEYKKKQKKHKYTQIFEETS